MATKVIVIQEQALNDTLKPIELVKYLDSTNKWLEAEYSAKDWDYIEVVSSCYQNGYALLFCYNEQKRDVGTLYLAHLNDGIA